MIGLLYADELRGFVKSKVMVVLWIGLPLMAFVIRLVRPEADQVPLVSLTAVLISSIGGTLAAVLLATSVANERTHGVYDLFLIRPVRRPWLLLAKYGAAMTSLLAAAAVALGVGMVADLVAGYESIGLLRGAAEPLLLAVAGMAVATAVGLLIGVLVDSVAAAAILAVYLGNQLSALAVLPGVLPTPFDPRLVAATVGVLVPATVLLVAIRLFARKSL